MPKFYRFKPLDIESRGSIRQYDYRKHYRKKLIQLAGSAFAAAAGSAGLGFYNSARFEQRRNQLPPTPPNSPEKGTRIMARSRKSSSKMGKKSKSRRRVRSRSSGIVSRQRDQSSRYRSSNRRRSRRSGGNSKFAYRVMNVLLNDQPLQIYTHRGAVNLASAVDAQSFYGVGLYNTQYIGQADLYQIFTDAGFAPGTEAEQGRKIHIKSACLDVELRNNGGSDVIMDVYELLNRKAYPGTDDYDDQFSDCYAAQGTITAASVLDPAVSIFENAVFCQYYKVLSKREVLIPAGELITMQMRISKDHEISCQTLINDVNAVPRISKLFFFMWHGPPDKNTTMPRITTTDLTLTWQKSYKYGLSPTPKQQPAVHNRP